jgi:hypothetical protein
MVVYKDRNGTADRLSERDGAEGMGCEVVT